MRTSGKKKIDMVNGSLWDKILLYALPLAATGVLQQLFNAADIAVVGTFAGKDAMAAVGSNSQIIGLLVNLFVGISLGTNVVIANAIGRGDDESIRKSVHTSILVAVIAGGMLIFLGEVIAAPSMGWMKVPDEIRGQALLYLRIYMVGMPVILLYNFESAIYRAVGNTRFPMIALSISGVVNVILNLVFVCGFGLSVAGVAIATVISNLISSVILFAGLLRSDTKVKVVPKELRLDAINLRKILRIGVPAGIQGMVFCFANLIIQTAINSLGTTVIAASSAAFNLEIFAYYVMNAFGQACTTFVGQNYGASKPKRCKKILTTCVVVDYLLTAVVCCLILLFGHTLMAVFNSDPEVIETGLIRLRWIFLAYIFSVLQEVFSGYLRGYGISTVPAGLSLLGICGVRITWIYTVFRQSPSFDTIMQVYPISLGVTAVLIVTVTMILRPSRRLLGG